MTRDHAWLAVLTADAVLTGLAFVRVVGRPETPPHVAPALAALCAVSSLCALYEAASLVVRWIGRHW